MSASVASACRAVAANVAAARSASSQRRGSVRGGGDAVCGVRATRVIAPRKNARRGVVMSSMDELDAEGEPLDRS